jgi:hypothetical protein
MTRVAVFRAEKCTECGDQCIPRLDGLCPACGTDLQERRARAREAQRMTFLDWAAQKSEQKEGQTDEDCISSEEHH